MRSLDAHLLEELTRRQAKHLKRDLRVCAIDGKYIHVGSKRLINLAGNDYLGLAHHPKLKQAAAQAIEDSGTGAGASRLVTGTLAAHTQAEAAFASFKHAPAALLFPTGYMANLAVLGALAGRGDLICQDRLNHASLIDAARTSGASVRTYPHLQHNKLDRLLKAHAQQSPQKRRFIVSDSVFSMDGDCADLPKLCDLADNHNAVLVVDEAHATGVLGSSGAGLAEAQGVGERLYRAGAGGISIATASKALGGLGGVVTGSQAVIDFLVNAGRPLIYTTAPPPCQAAALSAALEVIQEEPDRRERLAVLSQSIREALIEQGWPLPPSLHATPILPLITGSASSALALADRLQDNGFLALAIRPPTVGAGQSRVRLALRWDLSSDDLSKLLCALAQAAPREDELP